MRTKSAVSMVRMRAAQKALSALCESSTMHAPGLGLTTGVGEGLHSGVQQLEALAGGWQGARHVPIVQRKQTLGRGCTSASAMQCNAMQCNGGKQLASAPSNMCEVDTCSIADFSTCTSGGAVECMAPELWHTHTVGLPWIHWPSHPPSPTLSRTCGLPVLP